MLKGIIKFMLVALFVSSITSCGVLQMTPGLTGSGVYELGEIGGVKYYTVHSSHFSGPNQTIMISHDTLEKDARPVNIAVNGGDGIGKALIGAAGNVASSYVFGKSLKPANESSSVEVTGGNAAGGKGGKSSSKGGNATGGKGGKGGKATGGKGGKGGNATGGKGGNATSKGGNATSKGTSKPGPSRPRRG